MKSHPPVAIVTGAAGLGVGTEIVRALAATHAVGVNALRMEQIAEAMALCGLGEEDAIALQGDVSKAPDVHAMMSHVLQRYGRIDALVCNAARGAAFCPTQELTDAAWQDDINVILNGAFHCVREVIPSMARQGFGRIVFISSSAAVRGTHGRAVGYAAAKAGLHGMTRQLALELAGSGIAVNCVAPSQIDTPRIRRGGRKDDAYLARYGQAVPVGRVGVPATE